MNLRIDNKIYDVEIYKSPWKRLKGFMFQKNIDKVICFPKCNSIHTFFMKCPIGVLFLDKDGKVLHIERNLHKNKIKYIKNAYYVIECKENLFQKNSNIKIIRD